ncbi:MAG: hypothetical protein AAF320_05105 [Myxococcota bacterium]
MILLFTIEGAGCAQTCSPQEISIPQEKTAQEHLIEKINFIDKNYPQDLAAHNKPTNEQGVVQDSNRKPVIIGFEPFSTYATKATDCYVDILAMQNQPSKSADRVALPTQSVFALCSRHERIFASYIAQEFYNTVCWARDILRRKPQQGEQLGHNILQDLQAFKQAAQKDPGLSKQQCVAVTALLKQISRTYDGTAQLLQH